MSIAREWFDTGEGREDRALLVPLANPSLIDGLMPTDLVPEWGEVPPTLYHFSSADLPVPAPNESGFDCIADINLLTSMMKFFVSSKVAAPLSATKYL